MQKPPNREQPLYLGRLRQLPLNGKDQLVALTIYPVLRVKQRAALVVALGFQCLDLFLPGELFLQCKCAGRGAARLLDLAVEFLDLALKAELEVVYWKRNFLSG